MGDIIKEAEEILKQGTKSILYNMYGFDAWKICPVCHCLYLPGSVYIEEGIFWHVLDSEYGETCPFCQPGEEDFNDC